MFDYEPILPETIAFLTDPSTRKIVEYWATDDCPENYRAGIRAMKKNGDPVVRRLNSAGAIVVGIDRETGFVQAFYVETEVDEFADYRLREFARNLRELPA